MKRFLYVIIAVLALQFVALGQNASQVPHVWHGGNGCTLFDSEKRKVCCTAHDRAYGEGGSERNRWNADIGLFKCLWKQNKFAAVFMFVGVRVGGVFSFQYGKRRELQLYKPLTIDP